MGRKTRKRLATEERAKYITFYDDKNALWINRLCEEIEEFAEIGRPRTKWQAPGRVYLQFSRKDPQKEEQRNEIIRKKRQAQRNSR